MKYSDLMLEGFAKVDGRKAIGTRGEGDEHGRLRVCAIGAVALARDNDPWARSGDIFCYSEACRVFKEEYGMSVASANNGYDDQDLNAKDCGDEGQPGVPVDVIAGMLRAIGY